MVAGCGGGSDTEATEAPTTVATTTEPPATTEAPDATATPEPGDETHPDLELPGRPVAQPDVTSGIPHIQLNQNAGDKLLERLAAAAFSLEGVVEQPSLASLSGARALTVASGLSARPEAMIVEREFAHIHPGGSLHLTLPTNQAAELVESGWGEWHPFALDGTLPNLVMVYAPRTGDDLDIVQTVIEATVEFAIPTAADA